MQIVKTFKGSEQKRFAITADAARVELEQSGFYAPGTVNDILSAGIRRILLTRLAIYDFMKGDPMETELEKQTRQKAEAAAAAEAAKRRETNQTNPTEQPAQQDKPPAPPLLDELRQANEVLSAFTDAVRAISKTAKEITNRLLAIEESQKVISAILAQWPNASAQAFRVIESNQKQLGKILALVERINQPEKPGNNGDGYQ